MIFPNNRIHTLTSWLSCSYLSDNFSFSSAQSTAETRRCDNSSAAFCKLLSSSVARNFSVSYFCSSWSYSVCKHYNVHIQIHNYYIISMRVNICYPPPSPPLSLPSSSHKSHCIIAPLSTADSRPPEVSGGMGKIITELVEPPVLRMNRWVMPHG